MEFTKQTVGAIHELPLQLFGKQVLITLPVHLVVSC